MVKRKASQYNLCMKAQLKGHMRNKSKATRNALFRAAAKKCSHKRR